ncbi:MAG: hypothetical protein ACPL1Y_00620, partial [Thermoplasmata archaeon]
MLAILVTFLLLFPAHLPSAEYSAPDMYIRVTGEDIRVNFLIDMYNFTNFSIVSKIEIRTINLHEINATLPDKMIDADEIRALLSDGTLT